jgi:hypothetical protein
LSIAGKAPVHSGDYARGALTRGDNQARAHARGCKEKDGPCGRVDAESAELPITLGSSYKTRDCIGEVRAATWDTWAAQEKAATRLRPINLDTGPERSGRRTPFLHRLVPCADDLHKPMQRLYYPPYHRKYNPIERCWGIVALKGNGTKLPDAETM